MNSRTPIFTEKTQCQDCFKCVRECPVKAIKIENACAAVIPELCIACGHCVEVCPNSAKKVRDDLSRARELLRIKPRVLVSLAPSFVSEFPKVKPEVLIQALRQLGFWGVSETALGAQWVSGSAAKSLKEAPPRLIISSACPVIVGYLEKYQPRFANRLTPVMSPVLAHCQLLREAYGAEIGIVFISPCIAKKCEADAHPDMLDVAITFEDLKRWLAEAHIELPAVKPSAEAVFVPERAEEGALYPVDGGMAAGIKSGCGIMDADCMAFSGMKNIQKALNGLDQLSLERSLFLELLACEGGCVNGPKAGHRGATAAKRMHIIGYAQCRDGAVPRARFAPPLYGPQAKPVVAKNYFEMQLREALASVGKQRKEEELNCGGCGYDNCREFAKALLDGRAERAMCVTHMRKLAQKKANALMEKTPNAVVLADENLKIIECNANFARVLGQEAEETFRLKPGLEGVPLRQLAPFYSLFQSVLEKGEDILDRDIRYRQSVLHISVFSIEKHRVVCCILQDITTPMVSKERVIQQAQEVIKKNLATVQQIAYLLGENAAESEVTLNAIIRSFAAPEPDEPHEG